MSPSEIALPWMSFGSDAAAPAPEGVFLLVQLAPARLRQLRALLGHYVRDEHAPTLPEAVRRLTALPAHNLGLHGSAARSRPAISPTSWCSIPATIADHATFEKPAAARDRRHRRVRQRRAGAAATARHTGAKPGRVVRGPRLDRLGRTVALAGG